MEQEKNKISQIISEIVDSADLLLIDVQFRGNRNATIIEVFIDAEITVGVDECAAVSRSILQQIDEQALLEGNNYRLDVSTPGVGRALKFFKQYHKHIGRTFKLKYKDASGNNKQLEGKLEKINNETLYFAVKDGIIPVPFDTITSAKVQVSF